MEKTKISMWGIIFHICMGLVLLWVVLKSLGVINTPFWLEYGFPVATFIFGVLAFYRDLLQSLNKLEIDGSTTKIRLEHLEQDVGQLKKDRRFVKNKLILDDQE